MKIDKVLFAFLTSYCLIFAGVITTLATHYQKSNTPPVPEVVQVETVQDEEVFPNIIAELDTISLVPEPDGIQELHALVVLEVEEMEAKLGMR